MTDRLLGSTDYLETWSRGKYSNDEKEIVLHQRRMVDQRASFAMQLMERWGMVAATPDGDDSSGRQKMRHLDPDEVARFACETSQFAFAEFEKRGWIAVVDRPGKEDEK